MSTDDFSARIAQLDLPVIPAPVRVYSLIGECLAAVKACDTAEMLQDLARSHASRGSAYQALGNADKTAVQIAMSAQSTLINLSAAWSQLWGFLGNTDLPTPIVARINAISVEPTIEDTLRSIAREIPNRSTANASRARAAATRILNTTNATIAQGALIAAATLTTAGDGAELRHGNAIVGHLTRRGDLVRVLNAAGHANLAPKAPSAVRHLGEAMKKLNNNALIARRADEDPAGVESRWFAGSLDLAMESTSLGDRDLVVDLVEGTLRFTVDGKAVAEDHALAGKVRAAFEERIAGETYNTTTMLHWLKDALRSAFYARTFYDTVYVPSAHVKRATALVSALNSSGVMGRRMVGLDVKPTDTGLRNGLLVGFQDEINAIEKEIDEGKRGAESILGDLFKAQKSVDGFTALLGEAYTAEVSAQIKRLHEVCADRLNSTSARAAALEMD
jgi:hypothetical protein